MELSITVLGCGDAFAADGNLYSSYFIKIGGSGIMLDCGSSAQISLRKNNRNSDDVDFLVLSHFHGDHFGGVAFLFLDAVLARKRKKKLIVYSPPGGETRIRQLCTLLYPGTELMDRFPVDFIEFSGVDELKTEFGKLKTFPALHSEGSFPHSLRLEFPGKTIGFSGDTAWNENLINVADSTDLFICECSFYDTKTNNHLNWLEIKNNLMELKTKKLLLVHLGEETLKYREEISAQIAYDNMNITI